MSENKIFCGEKKYNKWGNKVAECTEGYYHTDDHVDCHSGKTWPRTSPPKPYQFREIASRN